MASLYPTYKKLKKKVKKKKFKQIVRIVITGNSTPNRIALGAAIGVFLSVIPTFGIGMVVALLIAWRLRLNLLATYFGTLVVNPLNSSFVYFINARTWHME